MKTLLLISGACTMYFLISFASSKKPSEKTALKLLNNFCQLVPGGKAVLAGDTLSVQTFYMSQEITNLQYSEFLNALKKSNIEKWNIAQVDSLKWNTAFKSSMEPYVTYYHSHPAYAAYPVVNVTKQGAEMFCEWLNAKYDSLSNGEMHLKFRIPTHAEWMRATRGDQHLYVYSWGGPFIRNKDGQFQANCLKNGPENLRRNPETGKLEYVSVNFPIDVTAFNSDVTAPSKSYWPNEFGLYNMNGNVSEMISDGPYAVGGDWWSPGYDIRNESMKEFTEADPRVGFRVVATYVGASE